MVSDIPECSEVVEDHGVIFPKGNVQALRDILQDLCDDEEKTAQYRSGASDFVCGKYNWDDVIRKTLELYQ